jgi:hypothetical protein
MSYTPLSTIIAGGSGTIADRSVTWPKIVAVNEMTFLGRVSANPGSIEPLTTTQAKGMLDLAGTNSGDQFTNLTSSRVLGRLTASQLTAWLGLSVADISGLQAALDAKQAGGSYLVAADLTWTAISGKPTTFTPSAHSHVIADVTGLQTALDAKQPAGSYLTAITSGMVTAALGFTPQPAGSYLTAINSAQVTTALGYTPTSVTGLTGAQTVAAFKTGLSLVKGDVGLGNVDNTSDANKPISTAEQAALNLKAPLANPVFTGTSFFQQPTPTAKTATGTLTVAELLTLIITVTSTAAASLTLPTGTLTDAGILSGALPVNEAFEWYIVNLGTSSGATTLVAGTGHTIVGNAVTAIGTSSRWLTRKSAANTFITYRIG